jgi:signal transduction histidine kinase
MTDAPAPTAANSLRAERERDAAWAADLEAAKLEALAEFAAGAGHEINNPLAIISGRVQMLLKRETDPQRRHALLTIGGQVYRIRDMIGDCMLFARPPEPKPQALDLSDVVRGVVPNFSDAAEAQRCRFEIACERSVPVWADPAQLKVVLAALVQNSLDALSGGGTVRVSAQSERIDGLDWAVLCVSDNGPGFTADQRAHLFDPFYSGRQAGRGLGFGLSKTWRIVLNHRARIDVSSVPGEETRFRIHWPARPDP